MTMRSVHPSAIVLGCAALALACGIHAQWLGLVAALCLGAIWLAGIGSGRRWLAGFCLTVFVLLAALATLFRASAPLIMFAIVAALIGYDLSLFASRIASALDEHRSALEQMHIRRVLLIGAVGLIVGELALMLRLELSFFWLLAIAVGAVLTLGFVARQTGAQQR